MYFISIFLHSTATKITRQDYVIYIITQPNQFTSQSENATVLINSVFSLYPSNPLQSTVLYNGSRSGDVHNNQFQANYTH